ncbi:ATP-binding protein [Aeromonas sp.]|uniref:ATP-binding protein n=1 Tax=Aeromonas sp. TaxID=647 RepID=UPI002590180A|nr:ATP-binding protein [Aeromonas sp.]MCX7126569.1 ATP-binding protein [Aeromonas sp.]
MINSILESKIIDVPWPVYVGDRLFEGSKIKSHSNCHESCRINVHGQDENICEHGLFHISRKISGQLITVSGVFIPTEGQSKKHKKNITLSQRKTSREAIKLWFSNLDEKNSIIQSLVTKTAKSNFDQFHEFVKWAREISHYSNRLLDASTKSKGSSFENASEDLKSLCKTSVMLLDSLDTAALYFNPASAQFGRKKLTDIYSMVHKIKLVLSHSTTNKNRANVVLKGRVENKHKVYESFKVVPLSLIQNAIKYKRSGDVEVIFEEIDDRLKMTVNSIGFEIPESEIEHLFLRGFRTKKAREMSVEGCGLGLYVLKIVADAHNFEVKVTSTPTNYQNHNLALNSFIVFIH